MADQRSSFSSFIYDAFFSFNPSDTGNGITANLLQAFNGRGITTYSKDRDAITPEILNAIVESRAAVVVLSKNYASSTLCLEELAHILDNNQLIFPIFYKVDPSDVEKQRGAYGEALARHEDKLMDNKEKLLKWKNALCQVANISGFHFKNRVVGYDELPFVERIVEEVSSKLTHTSLHDTGYMVGIDSPLKEVCSLLELGSDSVLMIGIYGMGGIGKTTLAEAVYNRIVDQFEVSIFLCDVRENSNKHGLLHLQNKLLSSIDREHDIQLPNTNKAASMLEYRLREMKVLLVLDDVDTLDQLDALVGGLDWFGSGSRVIITTRDKHLLAFHGVERRYEVQKLNHEAALELLSHKAFNQRNVDPSFKNILNQVVTFAFGLPLALEVIGSYLLGKSVDEWMYELDQFQRIPYNALGNDEKAVFLDIACCFQGYELTEVQDILCAHRGFNVRYHIKVLIDKSLISISLDSKVTLHPLIEDMGKEIVCRESLTEPGSRSRLWFHEDIVQVLKNNTGTDKTEIIHLDFSLIEDDEVLDWDGEAFQKMKNLRTLIIRKHHFSKAPKQLPSSLRVLEWWRYPSQELPSDFDQKKLDICKLPYMGFKSPKLALLLNTSHSAPEVSQIPHSVSVVMQNPQRVGRVKLWFSPRVFLVEMTWRLVGLVSSVVGLLCYAWSPSFSQLIGGWNSLKVFLYVLFSLVISTSILLVKQSSLSTQDIKYKTYMKFAVLMIISVYSFFYDKAVAGKPEILSVVSNASLALMSLSLSKLFNLGLEIGIFSYFLGCFVIQLWTINKNLILVAIIFGCPLYVMQSSLDSQPGETNGGQDMHSSSDSRPDVEGSQHIIHVPT